MAKMGRPQKEINQEQFEKMCGIQCTEEEIAGFFDCSVDTIERWCRRMYNLTFAETFKIHSADGKISLRRSQFRLAEKSAAMAIWLGKQYLDQKDKQVIENEADGMLLDLINGLKERDKEEDEVE